MHLKRQGLTGTTYLATITDLAQRIRLEDTLAGLFEAADFQWWWRQDDARDPERQLFWFDAEGRAVACLIRFDAGDEWSNDFIYLPSATALIHAQVVPQLVEILTTDEKPCTLSVRDSDNHLQQALEQAGFVRDDKTYVQTELVHEPAPTTLPDGFHLTTRVDDTSSHHMIKRSGEHVEQRLRECSLYRPELDLCIRTTTGDVAAYALFWMDDVTKVGLLEPMRTEAEYYRRGLAHYLIVEGVKRLRALGATSIRVTHDPSNLAAANLYHRAGFVDRFVQFNYTRHPANNNSQNEVPAP